MLITMSYVDKRIGQLEKSSLKECERHHELSWVKLNTLPDFTLLGKCLVCYTEYVIHLEDWSDLSEVLNTEDELHHFEVDTC